MLELSDHLVVGRADDTRRRAERAHVDRVLFARRDAGDLAARDALVKRFLPLARSLARRYDKGTEPLEDLVQVASLALVKAVDRFDPDQGALDTRVMLKGLLVAVSPRQREVLRLRFEDDLTQAEIGELLGVSQMQISRIIRQAVEVLRNMTEPKQPLTAAAGV